VGEKQRQDEAKTAELIAKGTPVAQRRPDIDGGMNQVFAAKIPDASTGLSDAEGPGLQTAAFTRAPGTIPPTVNPPHATASVTAADESTASASPTRVASAAPAQSEGFFSSLAHKIGLTSDNAPAPTPAPAPVPAKPKATAKATAAANWSPKTLESKSPDSKASDSKVAAAKLPPKPATPDEAAEAAPASAPAAAPITNLIAGSQPVVSANTFDNRWQAVR